MFWLLLVVAAAAGTPKVPELVLYTGADRTGDGLIFRSKQPRLMDHSRQIVANIKSYCYKGHWALYAEENFEGTMLEEAALSLTCVNVKTKTFVPESSRFLGPADMEAVALTFYDRELFMGRELVVKKATNLPFLPLSFVSSHGASQLSNWSFFEDNHYSSNAVCYVPTQTHEKVTNLKRLFPKGIKTVSKGCDMATKIRARFSAKDLEQ